MKLAFDLERRTGVRHLRYPEAPRQPEKAVTCGENQAARNQTVDAPSVRQLNARWKTPVHAHGASNHTMDTTGTCHPQKLRWHALTWMSIRHRRNKRCVTIPQMPHRRHAHNNRSGQRTRTSRNISYLWENTTLLPMNYARCPRHIAPATCGTCVKKKKNSGKASPKTSIHHVTRALNKDVSELVLHVQSWPRAARRWTQGTETDDTNAAREHHNMTRLWRAGHCDNRLTNRHGETPHRITKKKNTMEKEPNVACFRPAPRPCVCTYLPKWRVRAQSERARRKTAHDRAPAHLLPHATTNTEMLKQTNKERKATQDVTAPRRKLWYVGMTRTHKRIRTLNFDAPAWLGRPIHTHRASSKQS